MHTVLSTDFLKPIRVYRTPIQTPFGFYLRRTIVQNLPLVLFMTKCHTNSFVGFYLCRNPTQIPPPSLSFIYAETPYKLLTLDLFYAGTSYNLGRHVTAQPLLFACRNLRLPTNQLRNQLLRNRLCIPWGGNRCNSAVV